MTSNTISKIDSCAHTVYAPPPESHESPPEAPLGQGVEGVGEVTTRPSVVLPMTLNTSSITGTTVQSDSSSIKGRPLGLDNQDLNGSATTGTPTTHRGKGLRRLWTRCETTVQSIGQFWRTRRLQREYSDVRRVLSGETTKTAHKGLRQISGVTVQCPQTGLVTHQLIPDSTRKTSCFTGFKTCCQRIGRVFGKNGKQKASDDNLVSNEDNPEDVMKAIDTIDTTEGIAPTDVILSISLELSAHKLMTRLKDNIDFDHNFERIINESLPLLSANGVLLLVRLLGFGYYGVVVSALVMDIVSVAIKFCRSSEDSVRREIQTALRLSHRNVLSVHDIQPPKGCTFVVMELAETDLLSYLMANDRTVSYVLSRDPLHL